MRYGFEFETLQWVCTESADIRSGDAPPYLSVSVTVARWPAPFHIEGVPLREGDPFGGWIAVMPMYQRNPQAGPAAQRRHAFMAPQSGLPAFGWIEWNTETQALDGALVCGDGRFRALVERVLGGKPLPSRLEIQAEWINYDASGKAFWSLREHPELPIVAYHVQTAREGR